MERKRYSREERLSLLQRQITEKIPDADFAAELGVSIWTLRGWKQRLKSHQQPRGFIEIPAPKASGIIRIHLPGNVLVEVPFSGNYGNLASLIKGLMA